MKAMSLFSCGGIGDLGLRRAGFSVLVANELIEERAEVFKFNYPESHMIIGDIWEKKHEIVSKSKHLLSDSPVDLVFATPPVKGCQKMAEVNYLTQYVKVLKVISTLEIC